MTTKEEVLKLAEAAGLIFIDRGFIEPYLLLSGGNYTEEITKLIELAKAQGAAEERQRWNVNMPDWQYIFSRSCQRAHPHEEMNNECQEITKRLKAIRNRERKE